MTTQEKKKSLIEDEWIMQMADLEDGCSVTAGSIEPEYFFKEVEKRKLKSKTGDKNVAIQETS